MIPIIDFSPAVKDEKGSESYRRLVDEIHSAFSEIGFVYLKNHGISQEKVDQYFQISRLFFNQSYECKMEHARPKGRIHGYTQCGTENLNPERPVGDLKESYYYAPWTCPVETPKVDEVPRFDAVNCDMFKECSKLMLQILEVMGRGLKLDDPLLFVKAHQKLGSLGSETTLRTIFYPATVGHASQGQVRCGEHTDYGSITLLFQDNQGGLEVMTREGRYVAAVPVEGCVVINIGDMMQRWTSDRLVSSRHRVLIPDSEEKRATYRQSLAFFGQPDNGLTISCISGTNNKYPPITPEEYLKYKYSLTYQY